MIVDADSHINEPLEIFERFLDEPYRSRRPKVVKDTFGLTRLLMEGRLHPEPRFKQIHSEKIEGPKMGGVRPGAGDSKSRLVDLDLEGIDVQVIFGSIALALATFTDKDFAAAMCRACNDFYAEFTSVDPKRLKAMATLPLQDISMSIEELRRAKRELNHLGVVLPPNVNAKPIGHPDFHPLFEEIQNLDMPVGIHWGNASYIPGAGTERFDTYFMSHLMGHPIEQMIAVASLISGGAFDEFPRLRAAFLEGGCGWLPFWLERMDEHYEKRAAEVPLMKRSPREYFDSGNCFITTEPEEVLLPAVVDTLGDGCILFGSDYPHTDSKFPNTVKFIREREGLSEASKERILSNGARWIGL